jgi:hypothetical protein
MKRTVFCLLVFLLISSVVTKAGIKVPFPVSPLLPFSQSWNGEKYDVANTARLANYMSETEREIIYILNLMRMDPALFESTVVSQYPEFSGNPGLRNSSYYKSLRSDLKKTGKLKMLLPNKFAFSSAECHAKLSGSSGYVGHDRQSASCKKASFYFGECISYGYNKALDIVMALLIDENVPSLGHRKNFLADFKSIGVSVQPHASYRYNAVIDLAH